MFLASLLTAVQCHLSELAQLEWPNQIVKHLKDTQGSIAVSVVEA